MPTLTNLDRDLMSKLAVQPLLLALYSQHPDLAQLNKLMGYGWVAAVHYQQGGTIYYLTALGRKVLAGQGT